MTGLSTVITFAPLEPSEPLPSRWVDINADGRIPAIVGVERGSMPCHKKPVTLNAGQAMLIR